MQTVFLDSSVLFTAVNSPTGGSAKLFTIKDIRLTTSKVVLAEVERNVREKLESYHLERFFTLVENIVILDLSPNKRGIDKARKVIVEKDAVILAEAKQAKASVLVTLDRKHFLTSSVKKFLRPKKVMTPKMILEKLG